MSKLGVRISRWSLFLSLAVKAGLAIWVLFALLGEPTGSVALPAPAAEALRTPSAVEPAKETRRQRRDRQRRERLQREEEAARAAEKAEAAEKEAAEKEAAAREAAAKEAAAKEAAAQEAAALEATKRRSDQSIAGEPIGKNAFDVPAPPKGKARTDPGKGTASNTIPAPSEPAPEPDRWSDQEIIAALEECMTLLAPIAAHIDVSKPIRSGQCGAPAVVLLKRVGVSSPVEISPPATLNCRMVAKLHEWVETSLQPAARETFNAPVRRLVSASGYTCRNRYGSSVTKISEHAFANALDISAIVTADGRSIDVLGHWGKTERDLRAIAQAKAEAERQAKAAAAAEKAAKSGKAVEPEPADPKKAKADGKDGPAARDPSSKQGRNEPAAKDAEAVEGEPTPRGDPRQKDARRQPPIASVERRGLGRPDVLPVPGSVAGDDVVTKEGAFLRRLHRGACGIFGTVLGPEANEAHRNHFHFDLAPRRRSAFCE